MTWWKRKPSGDGDDAVGDEQAVAVDPLPASRELFEDWLEAQQPRVSRFRDLLDTQVVLWHLGGERSLAAPAKEAIATADDLLFSGGDPSDASSRPFRQASHRAGAFREPGRRHG